jgi:hypothetical protein
VDNNTVMRNKSMLNGVSPGLIDLHQQEVIVRRYWYIGILATIVAAFGAVVARHKMGSFDSVTAKGATGNSNLDTSSCAAGFFTQRLLAGMLVRGHS